MTTAAARRDHDEVLGALRALATETGVSPQRGERVRADRRSGYHYLGIATAARRRRVAAGFSFTDDTEERVLGSWDGIWNMSDNGDVLFAVLDAYRPKVAKEPSLVFWRTAQGWIERIDNWAHADDLARLYSYVLEAHRDDVLPTLTTWSTTQSEWHRRVAVVSLVHYSGTNAVFMPIEPCLALIANCVDDPRRSVHQAVGWVLRETMAVHRPKVIDFLRANASVMPRPAIRRAIEKLPEEERDQFLSTLT
ncbi:MAG: DNA alkylation repair protein [Actinomycetota bacterium]